MKRIKMIRETHRDLLSIFYSVYKDNKFYAGNMSFESALLTKNRLEKKLVKEQEIENKLLDICS